MSMATDRKSKMTLYVNDDALQRMKEQRKIDAWDFLQLFFPEDQCPIQFSAANKFMKQLFQEKILESRDFQKHMNYQEYRALIHVILPKLERFGLIEVTGERGRGKSYKVQTSNKFTNNLQHMSMEWFRVYTKHGY